MNPLDQLSLVWQVWGAMLAGAILMMLAVWIGIEWAWLCWSARAIARATRQWALRTFTDSTTPVPTSETRSGARRDADEILIAARTPADVFDIEAERYRLLRLHCLLQRTTDAMSAKRGSWTVH